MSEIRHSFCRICNNSCALTIEVEDGRAVRITGDPDNPLYDRFTCIKGRAQTEYLYHPDRLLHSLKRMPDGSFRKIPVEAAMDEIAEKLLLIRERNGANAIASYEGCMFWASYSTSRPMMTAMMDTIGSSMRFDPITIDKGGKQVASSIHGRWMAPSGEFDDPNVILLIGTNPVVTYTGLPAGNPARWLKMQKQQGMKLIVIDPRSSDVAKRAEIHLRPLPGFDVDIAACFIRVILKERLYDSDFVNDNVSGLDELRKQVEAFDPQMVAERAGLNPDDLVLAARTFASHKRGYVMAGTGPHMSTQGTLLEYLLLSLQSLCGYWLRAGDSVVAAPVLLPRRDYKAQAKSPESNWAYGEPLGVLGLHKTMAGLPVTVLPDEILKEQNDRIRALISVGGNPATAFPDHNKTITALNSLELFVQVDPWMSRSSELADYIIAPTMPLEAAATTQSIDLLTEWPGYGYGVSHAQYTTAVVPPPKDSELIDDWKFLEGLAKRMGFDGKVYGMDGQPRQLPKYCTSEQLLELMSLDARVPLSEIKSHVSGGLFPDANIVVGPKEEGWNERFELGNAEMMQELERQATGGAPVGPKDDEYSLRLVCRRHRHLYNSSCNVSATNRGKPYNPAFLNPEDMKSRDLSKGDPVTILSAHGKVNAVAEADNDLKPGLVSIMFGYGPGTDGYDDASIVGTNPNSLINCEAVYDRFTGQPRMSNLPVEVIRTTSMTS